MLAQELSEPVEILVDQGQRVCRIRWADMPRADAAARYARSPAVGCQDLAS